MCAHRLDITKKSIHGSFIYVNHLFTEIYRFLIPDTWYVPAVLIIVLYLHSVGCGMHSFCTQESKIPCWCLLFCSCTVIPIPPNAKKLLTYWNIKKIYSRREYRDIWIVKYKWFSHSHERRERSNGTLHFCTWYNRQYRIY